MATSSMTLLRTMEWAKKLNFGRNSAIGNFLEPALTSANIVLQTITGPPFAWRWNRVVTGFMTVAGQQDYTLFSYKASSSVTVGWFTVDDAGNCQKCTTAGTTGGSAPSWNHTLGGTTNDGTAVWTNAGSLKNSEVQGSYSLAWIETSSVMDPASMKWYEMSSKISLGLDAISGRPSFISAQSDDGLGNYTFRLMSVPDTVYPVNLTLQKEAPNFTSVSQTWSPIPDTYSRIYSYGFLSFMWLFADDPRWSTANAKFVSALLSASEGLTETEKNIFLNEWQNITGQPVGNSDRLTQGFQARGQ